MGAGKPCLFVGLCYCVLTLSWVGGDSPEGVLESRARLNWMYFNIFSQMEFATFRGHSAS